MPLQIKTLDDLFLHTLQDVYFAENHIAKALPRMAERAASPALKQLFADHLSETVTQIKRLDEVFKLIGVKAKGDECVAIEGIVDEYEALMGTIVDDHVRDAATAASAQAIEHYEITRYGTLVALAAKLGHDDAVEPLRASLGEEKAADQKLTEISERTLFPEAS